MAVVLLIQSTESHSWPSCLIHHQCSRLTPLAYEKVLQCHVYLIPVADHRLFQVARASRFTPLLHPTADKISSVQINSLLCRWRNEITSSDYTSHTGDYTEHWHTHQVCPPPALPAASMCEAALEAHQPSHIQYLYVRTAVGPTGIPLMLNAASHTGPIHAWREWLACAALLMHVPMDTHNWDLLQNHQ